MYAGVLIEIGVKNVDKIFTYIIPDNLKNKIKIGIRVKVGFGNTYLEGFVIDIFNDLKENNYELKEIISLVDEEQVLNEEMLLLGKKIKEETLCSLISAYQVMLPKALKAKNKVNMNIANDRYIVLNCKKEEVIDYLKNCKYDSQKEILNYLLENDQMLCLKLNSSINTLIKNKLIKFKFMEKYRYNYITNNKYKKVELTNEQNKVVNEISNNLDKSITYLLHGITGSGKTEVYMKIIEKVINNDKNAIMLVPEISLTPQIISRFKNKFGDIIAVFHSGLTDAERYDEYRKVKNKLVKIVIGARSAIFTPFDNLGIIIIDEEHSNTYTQDNNPKYHTKDIAIERSKYHNCPVILGSATPTLESYARSLKGRYKLLELKERPNNSKLPNITVVDMKKEVKKNNSYLSEILINKIKEKLELKEQVILLLNRRGYSSMITCSNCGYVLKCPNCDISLTYHKTSDTLRCHYCSYGSKNIKICPICKSNELKDYGVGTQKLELEIQKLFKDAKIVRMDLDTTTKKNSHQKIIDDFEKHKYDILLGTQMISKGLDFPLVSLVGVISADMSLSIPDFRSSEVTYSLLSQVSGRAGRANILGDVIIQTYNPDHYSIMCAKNNDYQTFFQKEMEIRKKLKYPPYYYLAVIKVCSKDYNMAKEESNKIGNYLNKNNDSSLIILGPSISNMFKINNIYHFQLIVKYKEKELVYKLLNKLDEIYKINNKVNVEYYINPSKLL